MASLDVWILHIVASLFYVFAGYVAILFIFPKLESIIEEVVKNENIATKFVDLLTIFLFIFILDGVLKELTKVGGTTIEKLSLVQPAFDTLNALIPYLQYIFIGLALIIIAERIKLK